MSRNDTAGMEILPAADGVVWLARASGNGDLQVVDTIGRSDGFQLNRGCDGWTATVDHAGIPWVVTSEAGTIYARRYENGAWGPRLQVSTQPDNALNPLVVADEYANVWIFWRYERAAELWVCRMGPRSGQETLVSRAVAPRLLNVATRQGRLFALYEEKDGRAMIAAGTEHGGFGAPTPVAAS